MTTTKVSVIIPTYNRAGLLKEAVISVLGQSYDNIEAIVVSDGGTDNTDTVLKTIGDKRLIFIRLNQNTGLPSAVRNEGIRRATGQLIAFCDDDDIWLSDKLAQQLEILERREDIQAVATNTIFTPSPKINGYFLLKDKIIRYNALLRYGSPLALSSMLIRKEVLDEIGTFDESPLIKGFEDLDLWLRILKNSDDSMYLMKSSWVKYRVDNSKLTISDNFGVDNEKEALAYIYSKHLPFSAKVLEMLSSNDAFNRMHMAAESSKLLYYGIVSPRQILNKANISFTTKLKILCKFYIKIIYYYYNRKWK